MFEFGYSTLALRAMYGNKRHFYYIDSNLPFNQRMCCDCGYVFFGLCTCHVNSRQMVVAAPIDTYDCITVLHEWWCSEGHLVGRR